MANGKYRFKIDEFGEHYQGCHTNLTCTMLKPEHSVFKALEFVEKQGITTRWDIVRFMGYKGTNKELRGVWSSFFHDAVWIGVLERDHGQYKITHKGKVLLDKARNR